MDALSSIAITTEIEQTWKYKIDYNIVYQYFGFDS